MDNFNVVIVGGGIGGLATAAGLAKIGVRSIVLERASELGEIGAGIQLAPNAFKCLDYLGVAEDIRSTAVYIDHLRLMDADSGSEIASIPLDESFKRRFENPYAVVHRADLHSVLMRKCLDSGLVELRPGHQVIGYEQDANTITVLCENQSPVVASLCIGADGLHSVIRAQMIGDGAPLVSGHSTYRSVIPTEKMPEELRWNAATLWAGPKCHIVHYPLKGWKLFNLVVTYHNDARAPVAGKSVSRKEVEKGFDHINPRARQIIEHGNDWRLWVLCDRDPIENWVDHRAVLLGDAAHPMLQYFAQGACMAMEDGVYLSHLLMKNQGSDLTTILRRYNTTRMLRTSRVQIDSRLIGEHIYHPEGANAAVRNHIMSNMTPGDWYDKLESTLR